MKFALISLGCSKNLVDSEIYSGILTKQRKFSKTENINEADMVIVNTCAFVGDAKVESIETILKVAEYKKKNLSKIIVTGCLAQRYKEDILLEMPEVDAVIGTGEIEQINKIVDEILQGKKIIEVTKFDFLPNATTDRFQLTPPHTSYIKIAEGCDRRCTYCVIPFLRGNLRSRSIEDIVNQTEYLVSQGVREINLLAQETSEYGMDNYKKHALPDLIRELAKIENLKWIRTFYLFPNSITDELIEVIKTEKKVCKYFDIPIQHISDKILKNMGRGISGKATKELLYKIRKLIPDATFRTNIIVGFPGETDEDFEEVRDFMREFKFDYIGIFKYSREEDTKAFDMSMQVSEAIKEKRWVELTNLQSEIINTKNRDLIGEEIEILVDGISAENEQMLEGRTQYQALEIDGKILMNNCSAKLGEFVKVKIEQNFEYDFVGTVVTNKTI